VPPLPQARPGWSHRPCYPCGPPAVRYSGPGGLTHGTRFSVASPPHSAGEVLFLGTDCIGVDGSGGELGVAEPFLHEVEGDTGCDCESAPKRDPFSELRQPRTKFLLICQYVEGGRVRGPTSVLIHSVAAQAIEAQPAFGQIRLVLLRHSFRTSRANRISPQHGHRGKARSSARARRKRSVAIEFGMWRWLRNGSTSGSVTCGKGRSRPVRGSGTS
jgi:hypothetical protein